MIDKMVPISTVVWFQEGPGVRNTQYTNEGVKLLNVANLVDGEVDLSNTSRYVSEEEAYGKYKHFLVDKGDLIIASSGIKVDYFDKKMGFAKEEHLPLCMNTSTIRFKTLDTDVLDIRYFMYFLKSESFKQQLSIQITGSAQLNFGPSHLKKMNVKLVPIAQQRDIVYRLSRIDHLISLRKQQFSKLDELVKARFVELFGGISDSIKYPYKAVKELTDVISGGTPSRDINEYWEGGTIPWVKTTELQNNIITEIDEHITEAGLDNSSAKIVPAGTVLIAMYGQGKTRGMTGYLGVEACTNQACACILPSNSINQKFLWQFFVLSYDNLRDMAKGGNQPNLNVNIIKNYPVLYPPMELQKQFAAFVEQTDKSKLAIQQSLDKLETLKIALMQKYFL